MPFIIDPTIGTLTVNATNFLSMHPALINELASDALIHMLHSHSRRNGPRRRGLSRRAARKAFNRKRRRFVDNIIMHHKRLHDHNRKLSIKNARQRAIERKKQLEEPSLLKESQALEHQRKKQESTKWQDKVNIKKRSLDLRSTTNAKKLRAQSRWATLMQNQDK